MKRLAALREKELRRYVVKGIAAGRPLVGPMEVHVDVTNGCNARCITCWDHSPLLDEPRSAAWKRQRLPLQAFHRLCDDLVEMGSVRHVVLSGMGEPLTHPGIYDMIARVKREGWRLTLLSNLVASDPERLLDNPPDNLLVGVHGASPDAYMAFHPGWTEEHFFRLASLLRGLVRAGVQTRHVQVIDRHHRRRRARHDRPSVAPCAPSGSTSSWPAWRAAPKRSLSPMIRSHG